MEFYREMEKEMEMYREMEREKRAETKVCDKRFQILSSTPSSL